MPLFNHSPRQNLIDLYENDQSISIARIGPTFAQVCKVAILILFLRLRISLRIPNATFVKVHLVTVIICFFFFVFVLCTLFPNGTAKSIIKTDFSFQKVSTVSGMLFGTGLSVCIFLFQYIVTSLAKWWRIVFIIWAIDCLIHKMLPDFHVYYFYYLFNYDDQGVLFALTLNTRNNMVQYLFRIATYTIFTSFNIFTYDLVLDC